MHSGSKTSLRNGKYVINHVLEQNGLGITLQGVHAHSNRSVIIKTIKTKWQQQPEFPRMKQRFQEQVNRFARCQHPGLVRILDAFEENGLPFAVMDYTPGSSLHEIVTTQGPLAEERAVHYMQQLCSALSELHHHGLVHRVVTPANIIQPSNTEIVVLTNFGLTNASVLGFAREKFSPLAEAYAAIEQYQTQLPITPATDIYALAGTLYFLLTGHPPLAASRRGDSKLLPPSRYCPQLSSHLETAILRGLELNPKKRPDAIAAWLSLLTQTVKPSIESGAKEVSQQVPKKQVPKMYSSKVNQKGHSATPQSSSRSKTNAKGKTLNHSTIIPTSNTFFKVVVSTAMIAASVGLGIGLTLRIAATSTGPGASFFHSEQSFPTLNNWPGAITPVDPPSTYSAPSYQEPATSNPPAYSQPNSPIPAAPESELAPLPEQAAEDIAPLPAPAPEVAPLPADPIPPPSSADPVPLPPAPEVPPSFSEPAPPAPSQSVPSDSSSEVPPSN